MGTSTPNYQLYMPAVGDNVNVQTDINDNMTKIDTELKRVDDESDTVKGIRRTSDDTATSGTTEKVVMTAPSFVPEASKTYEVEVQVRFTGDTVGDHFTTHIREDNLTGTSLIFKESPKIDVAGSAYVYKFHGFWITGASPPGTKVFVATFKRQSGTGTGTVRTGSSLSIKKLGADNLFTTV